MHVRSKCFFIFFALLVSFDVFSEGGDVNFVTVSAEKKLDNGMTILAAAGNIYEEFEGKVVYLGVGDKLKSGAILRLGYFGYFADLPDGGRREDHRIRGSLTYRFKHDDWRFMHRSRLEYRMGQTPNGFRYRPVFQVAHLMSLGQAKILPFAAVEPFYDFRQHKVTLTLFTAGVIWPISSKMILKVGHFNIFQNGPTKHTKGPLVWLHLKL